MKKCAVVAASLVFGNERLLNLILSYMEDPADRFAACLVSKRWLAAEGYARRQYHVVRPGVLKKAFQRYRNLEAVSFANCRSIFDDQAKEVCTIYGAKLLLLDFNLNKGITSKALGYVGQYCPNLTCLDLSNCHTDDLPITDQGPVALAPCKKLRALKLTGCKALTDTGLAAIAKNLKSLVELSLRWCSAISDSGIRSLANQAVGLKQLELLDLSYTQVTDEGVSAISHMTSLRSLMLVSCLSITNASLAKIGKGNRRLTHLDVSSCQCITDDGVAALCATSSSLQELHLSYCPGLSESALTTVYLLSGLRVLKLDGVEVSGTGLQVLGQGCHHLKDLSLFRCIGATDAGLCAIADGSRSSLQKLDISCCTAVTAVAFSALGNRCRNLRTLSMEGCKGVSIAGLTVLAELCQNLEELDLTDCDLTDAALVPVSNFSKLKFLKLGFNLALTDEGFRAFARPNSLRSLTEFDSYRCGNISDESFLALLEQRSKTLKRLNLSYCARLTDKTMVAISHCSSLMGLELRGCSHFTSAGLSAIAKGCSRLEELDLKRSAVNDAGLRELSKYCWKLRELQLSFAEVTDDGIEAVLKCPALQVLRILCCKRITARSISAAAKRGQALRKIKLDQALKASIPAEDIAALEGHFVNLKWLQK